MNSCHKRTHLAGFLLALVLLFGAKPASAQTYGVLFETFTNSFDLCPAPNTFDQEFKSTLSSKGSKVIHLNHHVANIGDPMSQLAVGSTPTDYRLSNTDGSSGTPVFESAVNRTDFGGATARLSPTQSEWEGRIDQEASKARSADFKYISGTYDATTRTLTITLDVTSDIAFNDSAIMRYAILQDNINYAQCSGTGPSVHNDVVRYITLGDSLLDFTGKPVGTTQRVIYTQRLGSSSQYKLADMKLVAFLEESSTGTDYHVTTAALILKGLDTLKGPVRTLSITDTALDGHTFAPHTTLPIQFQKSNVSFVTAYYSLDNGATWRGIGTQSLSPINWTVPDSATTTGKIKLVDSFNGDPIAIEHGTFTIAKSAKSITIIRPTSKDTLTIGSNLPIIWRKQGVGAVDVLLSRNAGANWDTLARNISDTTYLWKVTAPPSSQCVIKLLPLAGETFPIESDPFVILTPVGVAEHATISSDVRMTLYPNPSQASGEVRLALTLAHPSIVNIEVYDILGKLVTSSEIPHAISGSVVTSIDTRGLSAGTYTVRILTDQNVVTSSRLVIAK